MLVLEFGNWGSEGFAGKDGNRSLDLSSMQVRRARLVEWEPDVQWEAVMGLKSMINLH
jgi:hypothetical protein